MTAVHFGAGNIGRGFIGLLLHEAGHEVVFADVNSELIATINATPSYRVIEAGTGRETVVTGYRGIDSSESLEGLITEIAHADVVTTAVGPNVLRFVAPAIAEGIRARRAPAPLAVMACENAIGATDLLRTEVETALGGDADLLGVSAVFANTAVDRIVPEQHGLGLDVLVEPYCEWAVEEPPFGGAPPVIPGAHFVPDLAPYIERKLFTVNTGHATTAYHGHLAGHETVAAALADPAVRARVEEVLAETAALLVAKHGFDPDQQAAYAATTLERFANPALDDRLERVGRQPIRKLGRHERFVGPASEIADRGTEPVALLAAIGAALRFDVPSDDESVRLRAMLRDGGDVVAEVMGLHPGDALHPAAVAAVDAARD